MGICMLQQHIEGVASEQQPSASPQTSQPSQHPSAHLICHFTTLIALRSTPLTLLLRHTDGPTPPARRLAVLTPHTQAPVVPQTTMRTDLLQPLQVLTQLAVHAVGEHLVVLAVHDIALTVEEPRGDLVLSRVLDDCDDALEFFRRKLAGAVYESDMLVGDAGNDGGYDGEDVPLVEVDVGLLAYQVAVAAPDTLDLRQGVHHLLLAIDLYQSVVSTRSPCL